jgi:methionyl-tRNA formyltransferase
VARLRIIFMGTAELSCVSLQRLLAAPQFEVIAVVAQPDRPKGRQLKVQPPPTKNLALRAQVPVLQPARARDPEFLEQVQVLSPDLIAVAAYGQILPAALLNLPRWGCVNVHTSLLPRYRGAAPIQWALLNGDSETGVTIMKMDVGLDTGDILAQAKTAIDPQDDGQRLHDRLASLGADALVHTIPDYVEGRLQPRPQPVEGVTYARKITREDGRLDWTLPAGVLWNRVRGLVPWPGAYTFLPGPSPQRMLKIWQAEVTDAAGPAGVVLRADHHGVVVGCGEGALKVIALQLEGGRRLTAQQFLAGHPLLPGLRLGKLD